MQLRGYCRALECGALTPLSLKNKNKSGGKAPHSKVNVG
jgi:hypothetical protein